MTAVIYVLAYIALVVITAGLPLAHWAHELWRLPMTKLKCPNCPRHRGAGHYLCSVCWGALKPITRRRLSIRDSRAFARLRELHGQIAQHRPLTEIEVSP